MHNVRTFRKIHQYVFAYVEPLPFSVAEQFAIEKVLNQFTGGEMLLASFVVTMYQPTLPKGP
jgi:hypothetical protein